MQVQEITDTIVNNNKAENELKTAKRQQINTAQKSCGTVEDNIEDEEKNKKEELIKIISENETLVETCELK